MAAENAPRDQNFVPAALFQIDGQARGQLEAGRINQSTGRILVEAAGGSGTVTSVSVVTANGFAGSVANATTTPAITLTTTINAAVLAGNGTAIAAATTTGSGSTVVLATSPTLVTPVLGVATATSINKVTITAPASGSTLTIADGKTLTVSNTLTFTGTDSSSVNFGGGGTVLYTASTIPLTVGSTTIASGTNGRILYDNSGVLGEMTTTGSGTVVALATSPVLVTPTLGVAAGTSLALGGATIGTDALGVTGTATISGLVTGAGFAPTSSTATGNRLYLPASNTLGLAINGTGAVQLTATVLSPVSNDGVALGSTSLNWSDLFLASGAVINYANSNVVITHTSGILTMGTGELRITSANVGTNNDSVPTLSSTSTFTNKTLTSPTIQTSPVFATGTSIKLTVPTGDGTATGITTNEFNSGYSSSAVGDLVYLDSSATWQKADADASAATYSSMLGIALEVKASGAALNVLLQGFVYAATPFPTFTIGAPVYMSATAGAVTNTAPTTTDSATRIVGYGVHADKMWFNPSNDWLTHT